MAHHGHDNTRDLRELFNGLPERTIEQSQFGATGKFPQGRLNDADEGELAMGIAADKENGKVIIHFGTPTMWVGFDPQQARELAESLQAKADEIDKK